MARPGVLLPTGQRTLGETIESMRPRLTIPQWMTKKALEKGKKDMRNVRNKQMTDMMAAGNDRMKLMKRA